MPLDLDNLLVEPVLPVQQSDVSELALKLQAYNHQHAGDNRVEAIGCFIRDLQQNLIGGIYAQLSWGWCSVELLWVDDNYRGHKLASQLIGKIEQYAQDTGISRFKVETASFQALDFYKKMGFEHYTTLEDFPVGHSNYYLKKTLP
jgi:GNAT superfamily N-acetyltransferase